VWLLLATAAVGLSGAPALAQQAAEPSPPAAQGSGPKSLLPDDIAGPAQPAPGAVEGAAPLEPGAPTPLPGFEPLATPAEAELAEAPEIETPDPLAELAGPTMQPERAGLLTPALGGYRADLFAGSDARFLSTLLTRLDGPLASRWAQILLQRALLTVSDAPGPVNPADWVAARGLALVAMGAGADAHRLVSRIAIDRYTELLYASASRAALAAADPMALCPLSPLARVLTENSTWALTDAMCLAILGDEIGAASLFDGLRRRNEVSAFDIGLAERVASATGAGRRGANPEWAEANGGLTGWRIGLASAAGLEIPAEQLQALSVAQKAWLARMPGQPIEQRARFAPEAAATGAISTAEINRILAAEAAALDPAVAGNSPGGRLRAANVAADIDDRVAALKALWGQAPADSLAAYGWQVATAPAAARLPVSTERAADAPAIAASLAAAGITGRAASWWRAAEDADGAVRAALWAQVVAFAPGVPLDDGLYDDWAKTVPAHRAELLAAGLKGLGRGDVGAEIVQIDNDWTRALDRAVLARRAGEVIVIAATGLQGSWADVPPDYLRRIAAALVAVGHAGEAQLIVAEAANRG
jgi:hypothetical protein